MTYPCFDFFDGCPWTYLCPLFDPALFLCRDPLCLYPDLCHVTCHDAHLENRVVLVDLAPSLSLVVFLCHFSRGLCMSHCLYQVVLCGNIMSLLQLGDLWLYVSLISLKVKTVSIGSPQSVVIVRNRFPIFNSALWLTLTIWKALPGCENHRLKLTLVSVDETLYRNYFAVRPHNFTGSF